MKNFILTITLAALWLPACTPEWSREEREYVYNHCLQMATQQGFEEPENHCACALAKFEKVSPNPEDVINLSNEEIMAMASACQDSIKAIASFKRIFSANCLTMAQTRQLKDPNGYCDCVMNKIIDKYHNQVDMSTVDANIVQQLGKSCE